MLVTKLVGAWDQTTKILETAPGRWAKATLQAMLQEAHYLRGKVVENITTGGQTAGQPFAPLRATTLAIRQFFGFSGSKPLVVSSTMRNNITVMRTAGGVFVAVKRKTQGGVDLASLHEYGSKTSVRPMTDKQRKFLMVALRNRGASSPGKQVGHGLLVIRIAARPFMRPVMEKFGTAPAVTMRFWKSVAKGMNGDFGKAG